MSMFFAKPKPQSTKTDKINSIRVTQAVLGQVIPVIMGQQRVHMNLIGYGDFKATAITQKQSGGKGLGSGGGTTTTYQYSATVLGALGQGAITGVVNVWDSKGRFQQLSVTENFTVPGGGGSYQVNNHAQFGNDAGVGASTIYNRTVNDYGSGGAITLSGTYLSPLAPGTDYTLNPGTGTYTFPPAQAGKVVSITYSFNLLAITETELASVPGSPYQIAVQNNASWVTDGGVKYYPSGNGLVVVAGSPAVGQYSVAAGVYQFAAADVGQEVLITYQIKDTAGVGAATALNFTLFEGLQSQAAWGYMASAHPDQALGYTQLAYVASQMILGPSAEVPNYTFEVIGPNAYGQGIVDCDPTACIRSVLLDPGWGIGAPGQNPFPSGVLGDFTQASNFWVASGFFISVAAHNQRPANSVIKEWLEAGMTAGFFSEGQLKLVPYGDTSIAGNGRIFVPNTQPVEDLTDDDFINEGSAATEPIKTMRLPQDQAYNRCQVQWSNRLSGYNPEITPEQDDAAIRRFDIRQEAPVNWDFITTQQAATFAASLRVKRAANIRNIHDFRVGWNKSYLEPMDLLTLTTIGDSFFTKRPVRIKKIEDDPVKGLAITAEEFPWGTASAALYQKQPTIPFFPDAGQAAPGNTSALIIETPDRLAGNQGNVLYIFCAPADNPNWGGCDVYTSYDNLSYAWLTKVNTPARIGTLAANIAAGGTDPDSRTLTVNMGSNGILTSVPAASFDQGVTLSAVLNPSPTASTAAVDLSAAFNLEGIFPDAMPFSGSVGLDGAGRAYSANLLGRAITFDGTPYQLGKFLGPNLLPDSGGSDATWTLSAGITFNPTGGVSGGGWQYTGTGGASGFLFGSSLTRAVVPGETYTFSMYVDASHVSGGALPFIAIEDPALSVGYAGPVTQAAGVNGRISVTFTVPGGVTQIKALFDTNNAVVGNTQLLKFSNPQLQIGSLSAYQSTNQKNALSCTGQTVTLPSGQYQSIWFLATAFGPANGQQAQTFTMNFNDGTHQTLTQSLSSWIMPQGFPGEFPAFNALPYRNASGGTQDATQPVYLYNYSFNLTPGKTVASITLPNNANVAVLAVTLVVGANTYNFELLAYQNATLSGPNQYQLTPLHRGLYGSGNLAHLAGETFVRLDEASVEYRYDATYAGKLIFLKFLSFNTLGGREQALPDVAPLSFNLQGLGPGAIDAATGSFVPGMDQIPSGSYVFPRTAAHSSYRPTSNPLTATDAGASATISVASFFMRSPSFPDVSLSSGSIVSLAYNTLYFVYHLDLYFLGGAVTYLVTTTKEVALQNAAAFYVGSIITPQAGAPNTNGFGDGGSGAQNGMVTVYGFTSSALSNVGGTSTITHPNSAIDGDQLTFTRGLYNFGAGNFVQLIFTTSPAFARRYTAIRFKILSAVSTNSLNGNAPQVISAIVSIGDPANAVAQFHIAGLEALAAGQTRALTTDTITLPVNKSLGTVTVNITVQEFGGVAATAGLINFDVYDVWIEGVE